MWNKHPRCQSGISLVEMILSLVLVSIAVTGLLTWVAQMSGASANPVLQTQALYVAESYMEEILLRPMNDPDGVMEGCSTARDQWDDVGDFNCLNTPNRPTTPGGTPVERLQDYQVSIEVADIRNWEGVPARRIEVRVQHLEGGIDFRLIGYKANL